MKLLLLNGHGINLKVEKAKLHVKDGFSEFGKEPTQYIYSPRRIDVDNVIIYGQDGNITIDAIRWLVKHGIQASFLDWNGKLLTTLLPPESTNVQTKFNQYKIYENYIERVKISKALINAKFARTKLVLDYLKPKYPEIKTDFSNEWNKIEQVKDIPEIMMIEGRVASFYWQELTKIFPEKLEFETREYQKKPRGAGDVINCLLNYGYSILEAECLKAINAVGLDQHVGYMHEKHSGNNSLAYDLQEPYRFLIDLAVISAIEKEVFSAKDFIRTENYNLKLRPSGAKKLLKEIETQFNNKVEFDRGMSSWHNVILIKARELTKYFEKREIDFTNPKFELKRVDSEELRQKILAIPYHKAYEHGLHKGTLHYMKKNAKSGKIFKLYEKTLGKVREE
ncbi:MAG: CRISPR-associated endonuclease Cas1 [Candidatus Iainarchaeum archaeon]|uniref:CRISPR-associated endonuclease Cas1 n=1 Tax=Candidatus Iainarchaeum sp. TaxID=3101447 RepID=A0A7T9DJY7_9ARCH|nr:MAG: CRISPR-associated endonuclease Cas1 [Candidatus Diapherotrites archaeon]